MNEHFIYSDSFLIHTFFSGTSPLKPNFCEKLSHTRSLSELSISAEFTKDQ